MSPRCPPIPRGRHDILFGQTVALRVPTRSRSPATAPSADIFAWRRRSQNATFPARALLSVSSRWERRTLDAAIGPSCRVKGVGMPRLGYDQASACCETKHRESASGSETITLDRTSAAGRTKRSRPARSACSCPRRRAVAGAQRNQRSDNPGAVDAYHDRVGAQRALLAGSVNERQTWTA